MGNVVLHTFYDNCCHSTPRMHVLPAMRRIHLSTIVVLQLLSLVKALRETGHFTAVSVTRPFEFEGQRKVEAADRMIAALEGAAHLVVVVEQVLTCTPSTPPLLAGLGIGF